MVVVGPLIFSIVKFDYEMKKAFKIPKYTAIRVNEDILKNADNNERKLEDKANNWAIKSLKFIEERSFDNNSSLYDYFDRVLNVILKCTTKTGKNILREENKIIIDD